MRLNPCDTDSQYAFVSYCSKDSTVVWSDVEHLQRLGYNIWIDEPNLDKSKRSWRLDALKALTNTNCKVVIFYVSKNSLQSNPCLEELQKTLAEETQLSHMNRPLDIIAIDVENVGNITDFFNSISQQIDRQRLSGDEKTRLITTLSTFQRYFFPQNNEKVRILYKGMPKRPCEYYEDICGQLERHNITKNFYSKFPKQIKEMYRHAVNLYALKHIPAAIGILEKHVKLNPLYPPSALLLAHLYYISEFSQKAQELWRKINQAFSINWREEGNFLASSGRYSEAIAYLLAFGEAYNNADSIYDASKLSIYLKSRQLTLDLIKKAKSMGLKKAEEYLTKFEAEIKSDESLRSMLEKGITKGKLKAETPFL